MATPKDVLDALKTRQQIHQRNNTNLKCYNNSARVKEKLKYATAVYGLVKTDRSIDARRRLQKKLFIAKVYSGISDEEIISEMNRLGLSFKDK